MVRNRQLVIAISIAAAFIVLVLLIVTGVVLTAPVTAVPPSRPPPDESPTPCVLCDITRPTPIVGAPGPPSSDSCICGPLEQPLYDTFPHPAHTDTSYARFNFFNHNGVDKNGNPLTVWVTVTLTADARMEAEDPRFRTAYTYVYVDAVRLIKGAGVSFLVSRSITAQGRMAGGRIYVYYEDPALHDTLRNTKYGGRYPTQSPNSIVPLSGDRGEPRTPINQFTQLLEFTLDIQNSTTGGQPLGFIDYDLSAVDQIALPVYIYGGYDTRTLPNATTGNNNNGFPCGKAYIGCKTPQETVEGCPTQIKDATERASTCLAAFPYCELPTAAIEDQARWQAFCRKFDDYAEGFGVTQALLNLYLDCVRRNSTTLPCPPIIPPIVSTPTNVIYGCVGQFLLENHCLLDGSRFTRSTLDGTQCSAINRGVCNTPDYRHVPQPCGLSCSRFPCSTGTCLSPCNNYECFGQLCPTNGSLPNCVDETMPVCKSRVSTCNDSTPGPYTFPNLRRNEYSEWVRAKGQRFYGFSLDEEVGGGNQQCLYSTQLDIVVFPSCLGRF